MDNQGYRWLTDLSRHFLEKDYLAPGQGVDDRVGVIARTAERILGMPGLADRFVANMKRGWYSLSTPIWTNFGTTRGLPISCVTGDTPIDTRRGPVPARDIRVGDEVLTDHGRYRPVTDVIVTPKRGGIHVLAVEGAGSLRLTGDHLVLTHWGWMRTEHLHTGTHLVAVNRDTRPDYDSVQGALPVRPLDYRPIVSLAATDALEDVYDFTVAEDHSFCAGGVVLHNCFGTHVEDSMESILHAHAEVGMQTKYGGGTSAYFGDLRSRGSVISGNGESSGSVHFMRLFETLINVVSQGATRRGNFAAYQDIGHADILEFLSIRTEGSPLQDLSFGVCVPDDWMESMIAGDAAKRKVWARVLESRSSVGYPYILFVDNANRGTVDVYRDRGMRIRHSNLCCVTGDQRVVSSRGLLTARELYEQGGDLELFDGSAAVRASAMRLISPAEEVYEVTLENGMTHRVTACHKVKTTRGMIRADDLFVGDRVFVQEAPGLFGPGSFPDEAFLAGFDAACARPTPDAPRAIPDALWAADLATQGRYVHGLFYTSDPTTLSGTDERFLRDAQLLLTNLGLTAALAATGGGGWTLSATLEGRRPSLDGGVATVGSGVVSVAPAGCEPVYCCEVDTDEHAWVCSGFVTHNSEIMLPDDAAESFVCDLSSMNVLHFDEWKGTDAVEVLTCVLDAVMTEFIDKADGLPFMERPVRFARRHRALGIGWLGWHSLLQSKMIPFGSMEAKSLNLVIARTLKEQAYGASAKLAAAYGEPEVLAGYGRRNTTLLAIAPTKSSAFILGQVSEGVEPMRSNYYIKDLAKGKYTIRNPYLAECLARHGRDDEATWADVLAHGGSVQHLGWLSGHEREVFETFAEISPREVVLQAAGRQKYIDQGQSLNLMIHPSVPIKDVNALLIEAWRLGVKSLYYQIGVNAAQNFTRDILACTSCQA